MGAVGSQVNMETRADEERGLTCGVCPRGCVLKEGMTGFCKARRNVNGRIRSVNYGMLTSLALDPIEKKPLRRFKGGSMIISVGSFGCSMDCPFCQNHDIARSDGRDVDIREFTPAEIARIAVRAAEDGNVGVAYTYNEPTVSWEFVRDTARLVRQEGMVNVLVTNGCASVRVLEEILPFMDAMNIDLKGFREDIYQRLGGRLKTVKAFIEKSCGKCHVEITSLIVPGFNDSPEDMERQCAWLSSIDPAIPLHITRYFPRYRMRGGEPTDIGLMKRLGEIAEKYLEYVYLGNI